MLSSWLIGLSCLVFARDVSVAHQPSILPIDRPQLTKPLTTAQPSLNLVDRRGIMLPFYWPKNQVKIAAVGSAKSLVTASQAHNLAIASISTQTGIAKDHLKIQSYISDRGAMHIYGQHFIQGIPVLNHRWAAHFKGSQLFYSSHNFDSKVLASLKVPSLKPKIQMAQAAMIAQKKLGAAYHPKFKPRLVLVQTGPNQLVLVYNFQVKNDKQMKWYEVAVDAIQGQVVQVTDYVQSMSYKVVPMPDKTPMDGFKVVEDPFIPAASPKGWHYDGKTEYPGVVGNNVFGAVSPTFDVTMGDDDMNFLHNFDPAQPPSIDQNERASGIQGFYSVNMIHDVSYLFGFNEQAGNFQQTNFGKGGDDEDRVMLISQSDKGTNNAVFSTPPDGQSPYLVGLLYDNHNPRRDPLMDNTIVFHEFTHGITNRLVGGRMNADCMQTDESRALGEGWSDIVALMLTRKVTDKPDDKVNIGTYVRDMMRPVYYTTNTKLNPLNYKSFARTTEVHQRGQIWATVLYDLYWALVDEYGFSSNWIDPEKRRGNIMLMNMMIFSLKLGTCNPGIIFSRDALIVADDYLYQGKNKCLIWKAFAARGLGVDAVQEGFKSGFKLPANCH